MSMYASGIPLAASGLGLGYSVIDKTEPTFTIRVSTSSQRFQVCHRKKDNWKEVIAEFTSKFHAELFLQAMI